MRGSVRRRFMAGIMAVLMVPASVAIVPAAAQRDGVAVSGTLHADTPGPVVDRRIFSQFAEHLGYGIYGGIWVGPDSPIPNTRGYRNDVVAALKALKVPVVRWPGGCFADAYHWREGVGPRANRPVRINTNWGRAREDNSFGTNEFMDFAELIGAEAYVSGNVGSSTPTELAEWVEYMTAPEGTLAEERARNGRKEPWKLPYLGIGNELWGCGGDMTAEFAANETRRFAAFVKFPEGTKTLKMASGPNGPDYAWTETMMRDAGKRIDGIGLHYYTVPGDWKSKGSATQFDETEYARTIAKTLKMDELLTKHSAIMDKYDPAKRVSLAVDEWGIWTDVEPGTNPGFLYQQNSLRDAILAALNFNIFMHHADRVHMTNIAQMVNVLQAMILTKGDRMVLTPTYHVFKMYQPFQDATFLPVEVTSPWYNKEEWTVPAVSVVAARDTGGVVHVALTNVDPNRPASVSIRLAGVSATRVSGQILTAARVQAHNDFDTPDSVRPTTFTQASVGRGALNVTVPAHAVVVLDLH
jgi:alpha-N-arabinofuranosidase